MSSLSIDHAENRKSLLLLLPRKRIDKILIFLIYFILFSIIYTEFIVTNVDAVAPQNRRLREYYPWDSPVKTNNDLDEKISQKRESDSRNVPGKQNNQIISENIPEKQKKRSIMERLNRLMRRIGNRLNFGKKKKQQQQQQPHQRLSRASLNPEKSTEKNNKS